MAVTLLVLSEVVMSSSVIAVTPVAIKVGFIVCSFVLLWVEW